MLYYFCGDIFEKNTSSSCRYFNRLYETFYCYSYYDYALHDAAAMEKLLLFQEGAKKSDTKEHHLLHRFFSFLFVLPQHHARVLILKITPEGDQSHFKQLKIEKQPRVFNFTFTQCLSLIFCAYLVRAHSHSHRLSSLSLLGKEIERGFEENSSLKMVADYYSGGGVPPSNHHHHHHHKDVRLHLALFAIQCVCAIYNTLCQLFLSKNDESKDDWRAVLVFSLYRDVLAAPLLYVCAFLHEQHAQHVSGVVSSNFRWFPSSQDFPRVLSQAFLGIFCNQLASLLGIQLVGAVMASLVHLATPMCAMAIAVYLGQEKLNAFIASGVVVACVGAMSMSAIDAYLKDVSVEEEKKESSPVGLFALFVGSLASAVYYNLQKITLKKKENVPLMVTAWEYAFGASMMALCAVICVPFGNEAEVYAYDGDNSVSSIAANAITSGGRSAANKRWVLETEGLYALFFAVVFNSILKYALSAYCNKRAGVTLLTVYSTLQPVVTAVLALLLLSQPLRWGYVGAFAIFYGVWLVAKGRDLNATSGKMKYDDSAPTTTSTTISTSNTNNTRNKKEEQPYSSLSNSKELRV